MKKTPSALKWLAERRARMAGQLRSAEQVCQSLLGDVNAIREELASMDDLLSAARARQDRVSSELAALDQVIVLYDAGISPDSIAPVNGWQGNYGKRGALRNFLIATLKSRAPDFVKSGKLEVLIVSEFSLVFEHPDFRTHWYKGSFKGTLKLLCSQGLVERKDGHILGSKDSGQYRWKQEVAPTLAELREGESALPCNK